MAMLEITTVPRFAHRIDPDGKHYSICRACAQTVAKAQRESKLIDGEEQLSAEGLCRVPSFPLTPAKPLLLQSQLFGS